MTKGCRNTKMVMRKDEFDNLASELRKRGFSDKMPLAPARWEPNLRDPLNENAGIYSLSQLGLEMRENQAVIRNAAQKVGELELRNPDSRVSITAIAGIDAMGESPLEMPGNRIVEVNALFSRGWNRNFELLLVAFGQKSHMASASEYCAFLVLIKDVDRMLKGIGLLNGALVNISADSMIPGALDALAVWQKLSAATETFRIGIPDGNMHKSGVVARLNTMVGDFRQEFDATLRMFQANPEISAAMEAVGENTVEIKTC